MAMGKSSQELIVSDSDFLYSAEECKKYGNDLKEIIENYKEIMQNIFSYGIKDDLTTKNIFKIIMEVEKYPDMIELVVSEASKLMEQYVQEIEVEDEFIY